MPEIRILEEADRSLAKALWEEAFPEDAGGFADWYFQNRFCPKHCYGLFLEGTLASMAQIGQEDLWVNGEIFAANLLRGVATASSQKGKGYASMLLAHILRQRLGVEQELSVLKTFIHPCYETYSYRSTLTLEAGESGPVCRQYIALEEISQEVLDQLAICYHAYLEGRSGYLYRDVPYFREMLEEALNQSGGILLTAGNPIRAYCIAYREAGRLYAEEIVASGGEEMAMFARTARKMGLCFAYLDLEKSGDPDAMARAICVKKLLEKTVVKGALQREVCIAIKDDLLPENCALWQISVQSGQVCVEKKQGQADASLTSGELAVLCLGGSLSKKLPKNVTALWKKAKTGLFEQY